MVMHYLMAGTTFIVWPCKSEGADSLVFNVWFTGSTCYPVFGLLHSDGIF